MAIHTELPIYKHAPDNCDLPEGWRTAGVATDTPAVCRLCLAVTGGRQCFEPACPGGVAGTDPLGQPGVDDGGPYNGLAAAGAATDGEGSSNA